MTDEPKGERERLRQCAREARIISIPGPRTGLLATPAVEHVARELQKCLVEAEQTASVPAA